LSRSYNLTKRWEAGYEDGIMELVKLRAVLCGRYVFGFYIENEKKRTSFESLQTELEEATECLTEVIASLT
jgi:ankyrin repeat/IBR domain-containing protein 1